MHMLVSFLLSLHLMLSDYSKTYISRTYFDLLPEIFTCRGISGSSSNLGTILFQGSNLCVSGSI